jgi:hypothetical protein
MAALGFLSDCNHTWSCVARHVIVVTAVLYERLVWESVRVKFMARFETLRLFSTNIIPSCDRTFFRLWQPWAWNWNPFTRVGFSFHFLNPLSYFRDQYMKPHQRLELPREVAIPVSFAQPYNNNSPQSPSYNHYHWWHRNQMRFTLWQLEFLCRTHEHSRMA